MQKGLSLTELAAKIESRAAQKKDFIASNEALTVIPTDKGLSIQVEDEAHDTLGVFPILPTAHRQLGDRLGIPAKYYDRLLTEKPELLAINANAWLRHPGDDRKHLLRTLADNARALLSNGYQRIDDVDIANAAIPVLGELPGVRIVSSDVTERRLYLHFIVETITGEVRKGDVVQAGGVISNSEIGQGRASVSGFTWRLICLNGAKTADQFHRSHVGGRIENNEQLYAQDTIAADDKAILLKIRDEVRAVVDQTRFEQHVQHLRELEGITIERLASPTKVVEALSQKVGLLGADVAGILKSLEADDRQITAWGLVNAVTHQAHREDISYDRAVEFEEAGGKLIELARNDWHEILQAA